MAGYSRQSAADIVAGEIVKSAPINAELNAIQSAFSLSSGHRHDSSAEGGYIRLLSDRDNDTTIDVESSADADVIVTKVAGTKVTVTTPTAIRPSSGTSYAIGTTADPFADVVADHVKVGNLEVTSATTFSGTVSLTTGATFNANTNELTNVGDPTTAQSAATRAYVISQVNSALSLTTTSNTTATITTATTNFTLVDALPLSPGAHLIIQATADNWVFGEVLAYTSATRVVNLQITATEGSGTYSGWTVNVSGVQGPAVDTAAITQAYTTADTVVHKRAYTYAATLGVI